MALASGMEEDVSSATNFQEASLERRGVFSASVLPNVDLKAGAQAAILDDEVSLGMEAMQGGGK